MRVNSSTFCARRCVTVIIVFADTARCAKM
jgi:hypothetical protein